MIVLLFLFIFASILYYVSTSGKRPPGAERKPVEIPKINFPPLFGWAVLIGILGMNVFWYEAGLGIGFGLFNAFVVVATLLTFPRKRLTPLAFAVAAVSLFSGVMFGYRANGFVQWLNIFVMIGSFLTLIFLRTYERIAWKGTWLIHQGLNLIPRTFGQSIDLFRQSNHPEVAKKFNIGNLIKTAIITVVILAFFVAILSSADPIFAQLIAQFRDQFMGRTVASVVLAFVFSVLLTMAFNPKQEEETKLGFFSFQDLMVSTTAITVLFAVFLFVQAKYLFGSKADLTVFGLSYSEYVRKGFIELLVTAFVGGLISYVLILKNKVLEQVNHLRQLQVINTVLIAELFMMLASALKRDVMYVDVYGLTRVRIVGGVFLAWLAGLLALLLILTLLRKVKESVFFSGMFVLSVGVIAFLNLVNVDRMIVEAKPGHHSFKDEFYITQLSEDAVDGWRDAVPEMEDTFRQLRAKKDFTDVDKAQLANIKLAAITLQDQRLKLEKKYGEEKMVKEKHFNNSEFPQEWKARRKWQAYNWYQYQAYQELDENRSLYWDRVDQLRRDIEEFQAKYNIDLYEQERRLLYDFKYPFVRVSLEDYYPESVNQIQYRNGVTPTR